MAIYDHLPTYHQIEVNNLKGLQPGFVVAQMEVDCGDKMSINYNTNATFTQEKFNRVGSKDGTHTNMIANGHIVQISKDGITDVKNATDPLFIVYNEPLNTLLNSDKYYATNMDNECLRLVQLIPGDEWTSDMDLLGATPEMFASTDYPGKANLANRIAVVDENSRMSNDDWFANKELADGTKAFHYIFLK